MATLPETATWETGIYQLEETDRVQGGASGVSNNQGKQLANRTKYLYTFKADLASPVFTGVPVAPTPTPGDNSTQIATTSFVATSFSPLASPTFTGIPAAPTAASGTASTQIATTAFVDTYFAKLASPTFTGTPSAPTASLSTSTTQLATTAFVRTGVSDASNAAAGAVGEYQSNTGTSVTLTTNVNANLAQLTLTAGDWDITGVGQFVGGNATLIKLGIHTVSATFGAFNTYIQVSANFPASSTSNINGPATYRLSVSASTTVYLVAMSTFSATQTAQGFLAARRVR